MAIFITGSTGYIGAHVAANLLEQEQTLNVLVRAGSDDEAANRLWRSLQLHFDFERFHRHLVERVHVFRGDLSSPRFGMSDDDYAQLVATSDSIVHCAASLNRKSEKACLNVNLRGTLEMIQLARRAHAAGGLRRFSHVSTVAIAGHRQDEVVLEDEALDWERSDYDPYARTKKFCEHMLRELLPPDAQLTIFRPSIVLGDSRHGETTQFEMVRAFVFLAKLPILPFRPDDRLDIVPVEYVADAISTLHLASQPRHDVYHLSSGTGSQTFRELTDALTRARGGRAPRYAPFLRRPFTALVNAAAERRGTPMGYAASLLKVFLPYLYFNTVFDNRRIVHEMGRAPVPFSEYSYPLLRFSTENRFRYNYRDWPQAVEGGVRS